MPRAQGAFRIQAKHFFLTYPRWSNDADRQTLLHDIKDELANKLAAHDPPYTILKYIVAKETHADGGTHVHVYLQLDKRASISSSSFFDIFDQHGNYQSCRSPSSVKEYCTKDDNFISNFFRTKVTWADVHGAETEEEFRAKLAQADPKSAVVFHDRIDSYVAKRYNNQHAWTPQYPRESFRGIGDINDFIQDELTETTGRGKALVIQSPSGYGKTEAVRTILHSLDVKYVYMSNIFNAKEFPPQLDGIRFLVFDDFDLEQFFRWSWKAFFGCQREFTVTDKYMAKRTLRFPQRWSFIWLCNYEQNPLRAEWGQGVPASAKQYLLERNTEEIILHHKLYNEN